MVAAKGWVSFVSGGEIVFASSVVRIHVSTVSPLQCKRGAVIKR